uniref:Cell cycle control protein 50C n=1 Tax=Homo sapiens TaxID=9606 RepID=CC50C_HUMAN|nr:RecName: Full=Cell cycle control protein 50C; AltName: Full=Transmembrane protein 30C [Homo sapiens]
MEERAQHCLSRLLDNSALKQQELPIHRLYFTARRVLFVFFATGIFCLCMGIILILSARSTQEIEINYTRICANCAKLRENASNFDKECTCSIPFYLSGKMMVGEIQETRLTLH